MGEAKRLQIPLVISSLVMLVPFALAYLFPLEFWGTNFHTYLPIYATAAVLVTAWLVAWRSTSTGLPKFPNVRPWVWSLGVAIVMWLLYNYLFMRTQLYGDVLLNLKFLEKGGSMANQYHFMGALHPDIFSSKNGEQFTFSLAAGISTHTGVNIWEAFRLIAATFGMAFAFLWMQFVQRKVSSLPWRIVAAALGLTAGATNVFYAEPEVYAAPVFFFGAYLISLVHFLEKRDARWYLLLVPLLLLCIRSHSAGYALLPTLLYALTVTWADLHVSRAKWITWRRAGWLIPLLVLVGATSMYFTAYKAGDDSIKVVSNAGNMFLTLLGDKTQDNAYYMLGRWHIWDYVQELLFCSAMGLAVMIGSLAAPGRRQLWGGPPMVGVSIGLFMLGALYFAVDPHVTMPRDWDLFCLMSPPLLVIGVLLLGRWETCLPKATATIGLLLSLAGLQFTVAWVNHDNQRVHTRQLDVAQYLFISQEAGGCYLVRHAIEAMTAVPAERLKMLEAQLKTLAPYESAVHKADFALLYQYAGSLAFAVNDHNRAMRYYQGANERLPGNVLILEDLATVSYQLRYNARARTHAIQSMRAGSKNSTMWAIAYTTSLQAGQQQLALQVGEEYLQKFGDPNQIGAGIQALRQSMTAPGTNMPTQSPK